ncbi:MAG: DUF502 domain-containing protein [Verrucomicrobia bacterium]|nr:DUF502 domain-containing protein [Verrucomicrobiota bacterium]
MEIPKKLAQLQTLAACWLEKAIAGAQTIRPVLSGARNKALTGVVVAIPLLATIWVVQLAYAAINDVSAPALLRLGINLPLLPFFVTLGLFIALGFMTSNVLGQRLLDRMEMTLLRIPLVNTVYTGIKQVIDSFKTFKNMENFKRVVYLDYPADGARLIGFVTGQYFDSKLGEEMTSVVIPTAPSPMTGIVVVIPASKLTESSLTLEEAMKLIVSAGLVVPKRRVVAPVQQPSLP